MTGKLAVIVLLLGLFLVACTTPPEEQDSQVTLIAAEATASQPTEAPTERPTSTTTATPLPSHTPTTAPTETPTFTPTSTEAPSATPTKTPTATVTPTPTPLPTETSTPGPTQPPQPTATSTAEEVDEIVLYYISNPNDILGVFPVRPFDADALVNNMIRIRTSLQTMSGSIDGAHNGDAAACSAYVAAYENILYSGVFYDDVPPEWQDSDGAYLLSFIYSLDRTRPAYLSCVNAGTVDDFNYGLAVQTIGATLSFFNPYVDAAIAR